MLKWLRRRALVPALCAAVICPLAPAHADDPGQLPPAWFTQQDWHLLQQGKAYGVGMVLVAHFNAPVNRAAAERAMVVQSNPPVAGAWHWDNDQVARYRPQTYWTPNTSVSASIAGQPPVQFFIGPSHISVADASTHQVKVYDGGNLVRTMPTSMGMGGTQTINGKTFSFWTPPGIYTVLDKKNPVIMDSSTYGLPINSHLGYKETIPYAVRISNDGIYLHELDATVWAQGKTNTSHGCLNLNKENAEWFYGWSVPGDIVEVKNSGGPTVTLAQNGDWSMPWSEWAN